MMTNPSASSPIPRSSDRYAGRVTFVDATPRSPCRTSPAGAAVTALPTARRVAIVGRGGGRAWQLPDKSAFVLHAEAARNALADAGLGLSDVDAVFSAGLWMGSETAEYLGIRPRYIDGTQIGGCSFIAHVQHAMTAIAAGVVDVALITHGESGASRVGMPGTRFGPDAFRMQFEQPFGLAGPPTGYALAATRHMHEYGTTSEQLAELAVSTRRWAQLNPRAIMRDPLTVDDVLGSRMISWPLHLLDCCLVTDAGGAGVMQSAERPRARPKRPVTSWERRGVDPRDRQPDAALRFGTRRRCRASARSPCRAYGTRTSTCDVLRRLHHRAGDGLGAAGFCKPGEGGPFVPAGAARRSVPDEHERGGLSYTQRDVRHVHARQAVRQLRGECGPRQVAGAKTAICHGLGGMFSAAATLVCGTEIPG